MAILLTWNPELWNEMPKACRQTLAGRRYRDWWRVRRKDIPIGTRVFVLRQRVEPRGIVGSGVTTKQPYRREEDGIWVVDVSFDLMLNPAEPHYYPPFDWTQLTTGPLAMEKWPKSVRASGQVEVPDELYDYWMEHANKVSGRSPELV